MVYFFWHCLDNCDVYYYYMLEAEFWILEYILYCANYFHGQTNLYMINELFQSAYIMIRMWYSRNRNKSLLLISDH